MSRIAVLSRHTTAALFLTSLLNKADFPTFGLPTIATYIKMLFANNSCGLQQFRVAYQGEKELVYFLPSGTAGPALVLHRLRKACTSEAFQHKQPKWSCRSSAARCRKLMS